MNKKQYLTNKTRIFGNPWQMLTLSARCVNGTLNRVITIQGESSPLPPSCPEAEQEQKLNSSFSSLPWSWSITAVNVGRRCVGSAAASAPATLSWASSSRSGCATPATTPSRTRSECLWVSVLLGTCRGRTEKWCPPFISSQLPKHFWGERSVLTVWP